MLDDSKVTGGKECGYSTAVKPEHLLSLVVAHGALQIAHPICHPPWEVNLTRGLKVWNTVQQPANSPRWIWSKDSIAWCIQVESSSSDVIGSVDVPCSRPCISSSGYDINIIDDELVAVYNDWSLAAHPWQLRMSKLDFVWMKLEFDCSTRSSSRGLGSSGQIAGKLTKHFCAVFKICLRSCCSLWSSHHTIASHEIWHEWS